MTQIARISIDFLSVIRFYLLHLRDLRLKMLGSQRYLDFSDILFFFLFHVLSVSLRVREPRSFDLGMNQKLRRDDHGRKEAG